MAAMTTDPSTAQDTTLFNSSCLFASQWCFAIPHSRKHLSLVFPSTCFFLFEFVSCVFQRNVEEYFYRCEKKTENFVCELFLWKRKNRRIEWKSGKRTKFTIRFSTQIILYNIISSPSKRALFEFYWRWKQKLTYFSVHCNL